MLTLLFFEIGMCVCMYVCDASCTSYQDESFMHHNLSYFVVLARVFGYIYTYIYIFRNTPRPQSPNPFCPSPIPKPQGPNPKAKPPGASLSSEVNTTQKPKAALGRRGFRV